MHIEPAIRGALFGEGFQNPARRFRIVARIGRQGAEIHTALRNHRRIVRRTVRSPLAEMLPRTDGFSRADDNSRSAAFLRAFRILCASGLSRAAPNNPQEFYQVPLDILSCQFSGHRIATHPPLRTTHQQSA